MSKQVLLSKECVMSVRSVIASVSLAAMALAGCFSDPGPIPHSIEDKEGAGDSSSSSTGSDGSEDSDDAGTDGDSGVLETTTGPYGSASDSGGGTSGAATTGISGTGTSGDVVPETTGDVCGIQPVNSCQTCLANGCCEMIPDCQEDDTCDCWLGCVDEKNDPEGCQVECGYQGSLVDCLEKLCSEDCS